jgi:hypothetical protein
VLHFFALALGVVAHSGTVVQWYAPIIKIIGIKIIVPIKSEKSLRLMVHISKTRPYKIIKIKCTPIQNPSQNFKISDP